MTTEPQTDCITLEQLEALLADDGYDIERLGEDLIRIRDVESGISLRGVLEEQILFLTVRCEVLPDEQITPDMMRKMLDAENGISTSAFQLYAQGNGKTAITLNNFCKLQNLGPEDRDDILSCVEFLVVDVVAARDLLHPEAAK